MSGITNAVFGQLRKNVHDTSFNEQVTRKRVDGLEIRVEGLEKYAGNVTALLTRPFFGRLKWLLLGK